MQHVFSEFSTNALLKIGDLSLLSQSSEGAIVGLYTFIWATSGPIQVLVDGVPTSIDAHHILALTPNQHLSILEKNEALVYQFNKEFYCVRDHDKEVSCVGLLFFGAKNIPIIALNVQEQQKFTRLHGVFLEEMETKDTIQAEMLRMLLARFIIKTTRLLKVGNDRVGNHNGNLDLYREYNYLVENHFKEAHNVSFYAEKLFKSPKTLSNSFSKYDKSPLQIIHDRIILEAKRQLTYTDKTTKEIAFDIGFDDPSHLSRMFKKQTSVSPSEFKKGLQKVN